MSNPDSAGHEHFRAGVEVEIQDTAFWMAGCRASMEEISQDTYAKTWLNDASRERHRIYIEEMGVNENLILCLRNRYFLESMRDFFTRFPGAALVNIGAGFSSYPWLLPESVLCIEVDAPDIGAAKAALSNQFQQEGTFPHRDVIHLSANLNKDKDIEKMLKEVSSQLAARPSFFLIEGVIYYLETMRAQQLLSGIRRIQSKQDQLGLVAWAPTATQRPAYDNFENFIHTRLGEELADFIFHTADDIASLPGYQMAEHRDYVQLSERFRPANPLAPDDHFFWEDLYLLEAI
ncbi:MAG: class I SAM-dependent methyltransferase [Pseudomonadota bacterium]